MSLAGDVLNRVVDTLTPKGETTRLTFRRFKGAALAKAAAEGSDIKDSDVDTIVLNVNPQNINYAERKIIQKIPTNAPGRFIVFDWGSELIMLTIQGSTGNLLPDVITAGLSTEPLTSIASEMASLTGNLEQTLQQTSNMKVPATASAIMQNLAFGSLSYMELLNMSPKYRTFERLRTMYHQFDADSDVLTLEMGNTVYRGFLEDFNFDISADSPWNWKYSIVFVEMENLSEFLNKNDATHGDNSFIDFSE